MEKIHRFKKEQEKLKGIKSTFFKPKTDSESAFIDCYELMNDLHLTTSYTELRIKLQPKTRALIEILYFKSDIVDLLLENIQKDSEPVLQLLVALTMDLVDEIMPFLNRILESIMALIQTNPTPEILQVIFQSVVYIIKNLGKFMAKDIESYLLLLEPLLLNEKYNVFLAESLGLLLRKVKGEQVYQWILERLVSHQDSKSTALLIFESVKLNNRLFHSKTPIVLSTVLKLCEQMEQTSLLDEMLEYLFVLMGHHGTPESMKECWDVLFKSNSKSVMKLVYVWSGLRKGVRISDRLQLFQFLQHGITLEFIGFEREWMKIFAVYLTSGTFQDLVSCRSVFLKIQESKNVEAVLEFYSFLNAEEYEYFYFIAQDFVSFVSKSWKESSSACLVALKTVFESEKMALYLEKLPESMKRNGLIKLDSIAADLLAVMGDMKWDAQEQVEVEQAGILHASCAVLRYLSVDWAVIEKIFDAAVVCLKVQLKSTTEYKVVVSGKKAVLIHGVLGDLLSLVSIIGKRTGNFQGLLKKWDLVMELLQECKHSIAFLNATKLYLSSLGDLNIDQFNQVFTTIQENTGVYSHPLRLVTFEILDLFTIEYIAKEDTTFKGRCNVFTICATLERIPHDPAFEREKPIHLRKLESLIRAGVLEEIYVSAITRFCFALLGENFKPLWVDVVKTLHIVCESNSSLFWTEFETKIQELKEYKPIDTLYLFKESHDQEEQVAKKFQKVSYECTNLTSLAAQWNRIHSTLSNTVEATTESFVDANNITSTLDQVNCYVLTVKSLCGQSKVVMEHSEMIMNLFLKIFSKEFVADDEDDDESQVEPTQHARLKILAFLAVFKEILRPRKLKRTVDFYNVLLVLLGNGDERLQKAALDCVFTWQHEGIVKYRELISGMANDERLRDSISTFDMSEFRSTVQTENQKVVVDVVCRILFGKIVSRKGRGSAKAGIKARRNAIFAFLSTMTVDERSVMMELMLSPFTTLIVPLENDQFHVKNVNIDRIPLKKQIGFLNVLEDFVKQMRTLVQPSLHPIMSTLLHLIHYAEVAVATNEDTFVVHQARQVRLLSLKRLHQLYTLGVDFDFTPYIQQHFTSFIDARISKLETENTQAPSAVMELFGAWARDRRYIRYLVSFNNDLLTNLIRLMSATKVHDSVVGFVLGMIESIQDAHEMYPEEEFLPGMLQDRIDLLLQRCESVLGRVFESATKNVRLVGENIPTRIIRVVSRLAVFVKETETAERLVSLLVPFLKSSSKQVPETTKTEILRILCHFLPLLPFFKSKHPKQTPYWSILSQLFFILTTREARTELMNVFQSLATLAPDLKELVDVLDNLNAWSTKRIDEADFDRRFAAFAKINQEIWNKMSSLDWLPVLFNLFYYINDPEEFSIRTAASFGIGRFIELAATKPETLMDEPTFENQIVHVVFPQIKRGIKQSPPASRHELIVLLGTLVKTHQNMSQFSDMVCLLGLQDDEETNFFSNITHMQVHRRIKALRHLSQNCDTRVLSASNISNIFISICAHFVFESDKQQDHTLINEALLAIQACAGALPWGSYYACLKRFMNSIEFRPELEKVLIRLIVLILDKFAFEMRDEEAIQDQMDVDVEDDEERVEVKGNDLPGRIHNAVSQKLVPSLQKLLAVEDDEQVPIRTPLAIAVAKLLKQLPQKSMNMHLPKLLLTLANVLSSHLQSTRDAARATLVTISTMLGPSYLSYILSSLKTALRRGYQLHILAYTLHAILEENVQAYPVSSVDDCLDTIVAICVQDVFGETAKEREVQELKNKMREIKTSKSFETFEILAKLISFGCIEQILEPIKQQMYITNQIEVVRKIEDIFKRLAVGLNANESVEHVPFMIFCQKLLSESLPLAQPDKQKTKKLTEQEKHIKIELKREAVFSINYYEANVHLFIEFGLSLLLTCLKRERIHSRDKQHLEMMNPLVPLLGKGLYAKHVAVTILSLRVYALIMKWPLPELQEAIPVLVKRIFQLISKSGSTDTEVVQTAFKLLAIIIRDVPQVQIPEKQLIALMGLVGADIEEPDKQTTTFTLIRAMLTRKIVCNEVYDLMDKVAQVLVTNQTNQVRELCRHAFIQFLIDYPHGHVRFKKLMTYLVSNLQYEYESGRQSVLELFYLAISKFSNELFQEYADMVFLALVMVLVNDESTKCKEMAATLIKMLIKRLDVARLEKPLVLIEKWFQASKPLKQAACQVSGLFIDAFEQKSKSWCISWISGLVEAIQDCKVQWKSMDAEDPDLEWEYGYIALKTVLKISKHYPDMLVFGEHGEVIWDTIIQLQTHPHQWIRLSSAQLLGSLYMHVDPATREYTGKILTANAAMVCPALSEEEKIRMIAKKCTDQIDSDLLTPDLAKQVVKNLLFLSKCLVPFMESENKVNESDQELEKDVEEEEENAESIPKHSSSLFWVCRRLAYMARSDSSKRAKQTIQRQSIFSYFAALFKHIPSQYSVSFVYLFIKTLYITQSDPTLRTEDQVQLKEFATQVLQNLQSQMGTLEYLPIYTKVHDEVRDKRLERKANRVQAAVLNPQQSATSKIKKNQNKVLQRKRKAMEHDHRRMKQMVKIKHQQDKQRAYDPLLD